MKYRIVICIIVFLLIGCSPVYHFYFDETNNTYSLGKVISRLSNLLTPEQFDQLLETLPDEASAIGPARLGECKNIGKITTFKKNARKVVNSFVWVHAFLCNEKVRIVVVSGRIEEDEAERINKLLQDEFKYELQEGILKVEKRYRLPLE